MELSNLGFRAWYEADASGKSKLIVAGETTETDGATTTIVRSDLQNDSPRVLRLKLHIEPYPKSIHPHIAVRKALRYEELAEKGAFTGVHIESKGSDFTIKIDAAPPPRVP
jgi:hypothetical protein